MNISQYIIEAKALIKELELLSANGTILDHSILFKKSIDLIDISGKILNEADRIGNGY